MRLKARVFMLLFLGAILMPCAHAQFHSQSLNTTQSSSGAFKLNAQDTTTDYEPSNVGIIGVKYLHQQGQMSTIIDIYPGTPAEHAGLHVGDRIVEVDGHNIIGFTTDQVYASIAGYPGQKVHLKVLRCNHNYGSYAGCFPIDVDLTRMDMNKVASDNVFRVYKYGN